jgi:hypothetical protein
MGLIVPPNFTYSHILFDFNPMQGLLQMQQRQGLPGKEAC